MPRDLLPIFLQDSLTTIHMFHFLLNLEQETVDL